MDIGDIKGVHGVMGPTTEFASQNMYCLDVFGLLVLMYARGRVLLRAVKTDIMSGEPLV